MLKKDYIIRLVPVAIVLIILAVILTAHSVVKTKAMEADANETLRAEQHEASVGEKEKEEFKEKLTEDIYSMVKKYLEDSVEKMDLSSFLTKEEYEELADNIETDIVEKIIEVKEAENDRDKEIEFVLTASQKEIIRNMIKESIDSADKVAANYSLSDDDWSDIKSLVRREVKERADAELLTEQKTNIIKTEIRTEVYKDILSYVVSHIRVGTKTSSDGAIDIGEGGYVSVDYLLTEEDKKEISSVILKDAAFASLLSDKFSGEIKKTMSEIVKEQIYQNVYNVVINEVEEKIIEASSDTEKIEKALDAKVKAIDDEIKAVDEKLAQGIATNKNSIIANKTLINNNKTAIGNLEEALTENQNKMGNLENAVSENQSKIDDIESVLSENKNSIGDIKSAISDSKTAMSSIETAISANKNSIEAKGEAIAANKSAIEENKAAIEDNKSAIGDDKSAIEENESGIAENKAGIAENKTAIEANKTAIATNQTGIGNNKTAIEGNKASIETNKTSIESNKIAIETVKSTLTSLTKRIEDAENTLKQAVEDIRKYGLRINALEATQTSVRYNTDTGLLQVKDDNGSWLNYDRWYPDTESRIIFKSGDSGYGKDPVYGGDFDEFILASSSGNKIRYEVGDVINFIASFNASKNSDEAAGHAVYRTYFMTRPIVYNNLQLDYAVVLPCSGTGRKTTAKITFEIEEFGTGKIVSKKEETLTVVNDEYKSLSKSIDLALPEYESDYRLIVTIDYTDTAGTGCIESNFYLSITDMIEKYVRE